MSRRSTAAQQGDSERALGAACSKPGIFPTHNAEHGQAWKDLRKTADRGADVKGARCAAGRDAAAAGRSSLQRPRCPQMHFTVSLSPHPPVELAFCASQEAARRVRLPDTHVLLLPCCQ